MKTLFIFTLIFIIGNANSAFSQERFLSEGMITDAGIYRNTISSNHKNPFTKISKEDFDRKIDALISIIPSIDKNKFIVELLRINSFIEDEHTILFPEFELELPLRFELFDEGMAIIAADSMNQKYLLHRVAAIDNTPWDKIDSLYQTIIKRDNPSYFKFFLTYYFKNTELLNGLGITGKTTEIPFQLLSPSGDTVYAVIDSKNKSQANSMKYDPQFKSLLPYSNNSNYWFSYDEQSKTLYFNYQTCSEDKNNPFKSFNKKLFNKIKEVKPEKIILDLRFNSGGNSGVLKPFIERIRKSELNTGGRFFVLVGRKVMSSSLMNAVELKKSTNATFVGEPTGGNINHFGELKSFILPESKIKVTYSTKYWENWREHDGSFKPDIETTNSLADFLKSYDKALELIRKK